MRLLQEDELSKRHLQYIKLKKCDSYWKMTCLRGALICIAVNLSDEDVDWYNKSMTS